MQFFTKNNFLKKILYNNLFVIIVLLLFSFPAIFPLLHHGFFISDDGDWMIIRFSAFHQALVHGQFPVRWLPRLNFEYGYPVADFLYPGFMYLAEPFHIVKFGFVSSIKIVLALSMMGSAFFCYLWLKTFFSKWAGVAGALVYLYSSYHLYDMYHRGSIGEVLALAIVPFILWGVERQSRFSTALGIGVLLLSHNILAALFLPVLFLYSLLRRDIRFYVPTFLLGIALTTFFWLPALYDLQYTVFSNTKVSDYTQYFADYRLIGLATFFVMFFAVIFIMKGFKREKDRKVIILFLILGAALLFFSTSLSSVLWKFLPISFIQFPFRFLSVTLVSIAFLCAYVVFTCKNTVVKFGFVVILFLLLLIDAYPHITSLQFTDKGEGFYATNEDTTTVKDEYMPRWVKNLPSQRPSRLVDVRDGSITNLVNSTNSISFSASAKSTTNVTINSIYFPGWQLLVDGKITPITYTNPKGLISFPITQGNHAIQVRFGETSLRIISDILSLIGMALLFIFYFLNRKNSTGKFVRK